jgi:putative spermidine/putrescine transport system permease protein
MAVIGLGSAAGAVLANVDENANAPQAFTPAPRPGWRHRIHVGRATVLLLAGLYFLVPLYAGLHFALENNQGHFSLSPIGAIPQQPGLAAAFFLSMRLAGVTWVISMVLMVPTVIYMFLKVPKLKRLFETITLLPIVIPPIVLILGVLPAAPLTLKSSPYLLSLMYVILSMPFVYRSLAAGLSAIDLKTLVEASRSLGASMRVTLWRVLLPNLRSALLSATVLTIALVLGEFTMASLDLWETLPVWIVDFAQTNGHITTAVAMMSLIGTWVLLTVIVSLDRSQSRRSLKRKQ